MFEQEANVHPATHAVLEPADWPVLPSDTPIIYEDEELGDMGEVNRHLTTNEIFHICVKEHLKRYHPEMRVFANMNCYYAPGPKHVRTGSLPYFSSDNMVVEPFEPLTEDARTYTIGQTGPAPRTAMETLSRGTGEENDLDVKVKLYARLQVPEYILVDPTGELLPEKLLLKRLQPDGTWNDERDADGGVTSNLGFRLLIDRNRDLVVVDTFTGKRYERPQDAVALVPLLEKKARAAARRASKAAKQVLQEADARKLAEDARKLAEERARQEAEARRLAEQRALDLQAELERLRSRRNDDA